jgi:hypothetical protein
MNGVNGNHTEALAPSEQFSSVSLCSDVGCTCFTPQAFSSSCARLMVHSSFIY